MNPAPLTAAQEWRKHWPLVAAAISATSFASVSTASFGVMMLPIEQDLGWSRTEISTGPMLISLVTIALGTLIGMAVDRCGPRLIASAAVAVLCGALAALSGISNELWAWWVLWAIIGVASAAITFSTIAPVSNTFVAGKGLAVALVLCGSGISSFVVPNLANSLVDSQGWRLAYLYLGCSWGVVACPLAIVFLRNPPASSAPVNSASAPTSSTVTPGLTAREGFRSLTFYKLLLATFMSTFGGVAMVLNLVPLLHFTGLSATTAAGVTGAIGIATIVGRLAGGALLDRLSAGMIAAGASGLMIALPASLLFARGSVPLSVAAVCLFGLMGGALTPAVAYLVSKHFGGRSFATFYATVGVTLSIGVGIGPLLANYIYDRTHSYDPVLWGTIPLFAVGALLFAALGPYPDFTGTGKLRR